MLDHCSTDVRLWLKISLFRVQVVVWTDKVGPYNNPQENYPSLLIVELQSLAAHDFSGSQTERNTGATEKQVRWRWSSGRERLRSRKVFIFLVKSFLFSRKSSLYSSIVMTIKTTSPKRLVQRYASAGLCELRESVESPQFEAA